MGAYVTVPVQPDVAWIARVLRLAAVGFRVVRPCGEERGVAVPIAADAAGDLPKQVNVLIVAVRVEPKRICVLRDSDSGRCVDRIGQNTKRGIT